MSPLLLLHKFHSWYLSSRLSTAVGVAALHKAFMESPESRTCPLPSACTEQAAWPRNVLMLCSADASAAKANGGGQGRRKAEEGQQCWEAFSRWLLLNNSIATSLSVEQVRLWLYTWEERSGWPFDLPPQQRSSTWSAKRMSRLSACT